MKENKEKHTTEVPMKTEHTPSVDSYGPLVYYSEISST